jgi:cell division septum initiation protein DivIVA
MDIQHLIDRLEELIDEGRHIWFTRLTMIDEERALELIDQMRISIPEEVDKAQRVMTQRDRILAQANEEAARVVDLAREKSAAMVERDAITQAAKNQAANIVEAARQEAEAIRAEADVYALDVLRELERQLQHNLTVARNGIQQLDHSRRAAQMPAEPPPSPNTEPESDSPAADTSAAA